MSMKIYRRYIARQTTISIVSVLFFIITLHLLLRIAETKRFSWENIKPVVYELPNTIMLLFPIAILIGGLLALGGMNTRNEITAMRASGASRWQISAPFFRVSFIAAVVMLLVMEFLTPVLYKELGLQNASRLQTVWRVENSPKMIGYLRSWHHRKQDKPYFNLYWAKPGKPLSAIALGVSAERGQPIKVSPAQRQILSDPMQVAHRASELSLPLEIPTYDVQDISAEQLTFGLQPSQAWHQVQAMKANGQPYAKANHALWGLLLLPLTYVSISMIVLPFAFSTSRNTNTGKRLFLGVVIGLIFYVLSELVGGLSLVYPIPAPFAIALSPMVLIIISLSLLNRRI